MALARARRSESGFNYWPGFVDALSTLVLSIVFLLSVFLVVQYLISLGVSPQRLVAAGFAEFQPLDTAPTEEAYKRNRRIELKLTER
jgi:hypothetical protein